MSKRRVVMMLVVISLLALGLLALGGLAQASGASSGDGVSPSAVVAQNGADDGPDFDTPELGDDRGVDQNDDPELNDDHGHHHLLARRGADDAPELEDGRHGADDEGPDDKGLA